MSTEMNRMTTPNSQLTTSKTALVSSSHEQFIPERMKKANLFVKSMVLIALIFGAIINVNSQTTYDFTTAATLSNPIGGGWPWNTQAVVTIGGVQYKLTSGGNGSFTNVSTGGVSNSANLQKDGSGGDQFTLERMDGQPFQFYGIWVKHQSMNSYSQFYTLPPWYTLTAVNNGNTTFTYQDMTAMTAGTAWNNYTGSSIAINAGAGGVIATSVQISFQAIITFNIDNIIVGPLTSSATGSPSSLSGFSTCSGTASSNQTTSVSGSGLTAPLVVTAPSGYEVSTNASTGFASSLSLTPSSGTVAATTVYVRLSASAVAGTYNGNLTISSTGVTTSNVSLTGVVNANPALTITNPAAVCSPSTVNLTSATVTAGSTGTFTLSYWNNAAATSSLSTPSAVATSGTYYIKATTSAGCTDIKPVIATISTTPLSAAVISAIAPCGNTATGSATVSLTGGIAPFQYTWTRNGSAYVATPANAPTNLIAGSYVVSVLDGCGTTVTSSSVTISSTIAINLNNAVLGANALCFGGNGSINGSIFGGTSLRSLVATNTSTNQVYTQVTPSGPAVAGVYPFTVNLPAGTYSVAAVDAGSSCASSTWPSTIVVTQPTAITATAAKTDVCFGANNGTITVTASGGTGTLTYSSNGGTTYQASNVFTGLAAGTYSIVVKDANNCTTTPISITINQSGSALAVAVTSVTNVACNGASTGAINITASGGYSTAYTYAWTGPSSFTSTSEDLTSRPAGTYNVTVTDAGGCTQTATATITQPTAISASAIPTNVLCNGGSTGTVTLTVSGGTGPYTYSWTGPSSFTATTQNITNRPVGIYFVAVTDQNGCVANSSAIISQPAVLAASNVVTNVACNGASTGAVNLTVTGGTTPYTFAWTGPSAFTATTEDLSSRPAGTYNVTVTDNKGCTTTSAATITQPTALTAAITAQTNNLCNAGTAGSATVTPTGGTVGYTYSWNTTPVQTAATASNLAAGTYTVTVTDANACTATATATITQPGAINATVTSTNILCNGASTGSISVSGVTGGVSPFQYSINGGTTWVSGASFTNLAAGTYNVQIKDANGCTKDLDGATNTTITQPAAITATLTGANVSCNGGSNGTIIVTAAGGTSPYTYSINGTTFQASATFTGLVAGTYTITVKDANNCTATFTRTVTQPNVLAITDDGQAPASCANTTDGAAFITPTGGSAPYTYAWTGPNSFTSATQDQVYNLAPGTYAVSITDANGCTASLSNLVVTSPPAINIATVVTNVTCYQGSTGAINATITGGSPAFTFQWKKNGVNFATTEDLTNITAGTYQLTVTDGNFCQNTTATIVVTEGAQLTATVAANAAAICSGANAVFTITGTVGNVVTYNLNGGSNTTATIAAGGTATVTVTGATTAQTLNLVSISNGTCTNNYTGTAAVSINALPTANAGTNQTVCAGASVTLSGSGTGTYSWNNGVTNGVAFTAINATTSPITTTYTLTVTNANGCTATSTVNVTVNPTPVVTAISNQTVCNGSQTTLVTFANNLAGTTYAWTNNTASIGLAASGTSSTIPAFTAVNAGTAPITATISVTGTNAGCTSAATTFTISVNPTPTVNNFTNQTVCAGSSTTAVVPTGAVTGTNYTWTNSNTAVGLAASGSGTIPSFTGVNNTNTAATATVTVTPTYGGNMGTTFGAASENGSVTLTAPAGTYFTGVQFASYGNPTGTGGNYVQGSCHAANSASVVSALALGQTTVTIPANNATFGDPCAGTTPKTLAVVLTYGTFGSACPGTAKTVAFTVNPRATIANKTATICSGSAFTVAPTNGTDVVPTGTQYTWTVVINPNVTGEVDQTVAQNSISQTLVNTTNTVQTVVYTVTPISGTCTGAPFTVTVTVNPTPSVTAQTATICSATAFSVTPANGSGNIIPTGTTYSWSAPAAITGITGLASGTAATSIGGTLTNSTAAPINVTYVVTPTSGTCSGSTFNVVVTVNPRPAITNMTASVCAGSAFTAAPVNTTNGIVPAGTTYTWTVAANANVSGQSNVATAQNNISQTLTNSTTSAQVVNYTVTPTAATCAGSTFALAVTVNPIPVIAAKTATICSASAFTVSPTNGTDLVPTGTTYTWTVAANANVTGQSNQAVAQNNISQTLTNNTATVQTVVYTVTPSFGGCSGATFTVTVTVNPTPSIITQVTNACSGVSFTLSPTNGSGNVVPTGTTYTWTVVDNPNVIGETNANTAQANITQTLVNAYTSAQQVIYTVTPAFNGCVGTPFLYTVTVATPVNVAAITGATNVCLGSTTQLASATAGGTWSSSNTAVATVSSTGVISTLTTGTTTISYTVTNSVGCTGVVSAVVNVNALPVATITPSGSTTLCAGGSVTLTASPGSTYLWSNGLQTQSITVNTAGNYSVNVTNAAGCSTTSSAVTVVVNALPTATVTANGPTTFCQGGSVTLTASSGSTYNWSNGATTQSITVNATGNYSVTVTNASGCSATSAPTVVTVNTLPIANITSLNGNTFCQGGSVTLVSSAGSIYNWSNGLTTQSINVSASANLTVTVTNANGCTATSAPFAVTMNPAPVATITANGPTTFCQGGQVTLTAPTAASYQWNSGETTQSIVVNVDGPSTVTITNANGCAATSAITNITVLPIPTVAAIAGANQVCVGSTLNLTNATIGGVWSSSNTAIATVSATGDVTAISAGSVTINYAVTNASGCTTTSSLILNVNALPSVLPIAGANSLCVGAQVIYTNGVAGGTWTSSNVGIATVAPNGVIIGVSAGTATISYTVTTAAGCSSTVTKTVTVNALPTVGVTANGPLTFCQGGSVTLTATGGTSYAWSNSTITTASRTINASGSYTVTATNANGCFATSAPVVVNVLALPNAAISSTGSTICLGSTATLTATGGVSYAWSNGAQTASTTVNNANTYTVTVTGANGCTNTASNVVTVNANPAVVVTANAPLTFCQGGSVTLSATGATSYIWSNGTLGSTNVVTQSGTYYVQGTNAAGCTANSAFVTVNVLATPVVAALTGSNTVCEASTITLSSATPGGVWSTSNGFIATVNNAGVVTGMNAGTANITYTLSNGACNTSVSASVTVLNSPATPVITAGGPTTVCPGETVNLFSSNAANYQWNSGQLTNNILVTQSGSYNVTVVGPNGCAVTSLPMVVTIGDNVNPVIVAPINVNVNPNLGCTAVGVALGTPVVSDNCTVASVTNNAPALFPIGTTTVTWTVTDGAGNTATATQLVNVVDQIAPVATAPAHVTVHTNNYCDATGVNLGTPEATDNCTIATITNNAPASFPIGTTVVTWTITDATGNFTTVTQNVTVVDDEAPVVVLQSTMVQLDANGLGQLSFAQIDNGTSDNCGIASVSLDHTTFDCSHVGFNTINVIVTDNSGNQTMGQVVINVMASEACGGDEAAGPNVPDAFTPNGNSINDTWVIPGLEGYNKKEMAVYSRYGTLVYYSSAYANDWDGTYMGNGVAVPDGTYYYTLTLDGGKQLSGYVYINRVKQ